MGIPAARRLWFCAAAALLSAFCSAQSVTVTFYGHIKTVSGLQSTFAVGNPFETAVTYETQTPAAVLSDTSVRYENAVTQLTFNYNRGSYIGSATGLNIRIIDNDHIAHDRFMIYFDRADSVSFPTINGETLRLDYFSSALEIVDTTDASVNTFALPTTQAFFDSPAFHDQNLDYMKLGFSRLPTDTTYHGVTMEITRAVVTIPEPATTMLLSVGVLLAMRKRKVSRI